MTTTTTTFATSGIAWTRVQLPRRLSTAFKAVYITQTIAAGLSTSFLSPVFGAVFGVVGLLSWALIIASYALSRHAPWRQGALELTDTALVVHAVSRKPHVVERTEIVGALVVERPVPGTVVRTVEIELASGDRLTIGTSDVETAGALVERLGFGPGGARVRSRLTTPGRRFLHLPIAVGAWFFSTFPLMLLGFALDNGGAISLVGLSTLAPLALLLMYTLARWLVSPPEVVIGNDGVSVERAYGSRFFRVDDPRLWSALRGLGIDDVRVASVLRRAEERAGTQGVGEPVVFGRAGRSLAEWRSALSAMLEGGYRDSPKTSEDAARVLSSAAAGPDERIGAALALRAAGEADRVRVAAAGTANERVRVALEAVADDEGDGTIEKALCKMSVR